MRYCLESGYVRKEDPMEPLFFFLDVFFGIFGAAVFIKLLLREIASCIEKRNRKR